ncbi:MAG TPA: anaerobic ribonucleoside-triphosphate reductase [Terrimicrobiaceae bacterium]|nr:anaerobic ribonucleoside-triphosphate reductase [Terrimicrobiaceae bacterium]
MKHPILAEHERQRCEIWTRVMGYHRPVSQFNAGKQSEHQERRPYREHAPPGPSVRAS